MTNEAMAAEKQEGNAADETAAATEEANEAASGLRAAIGEASRTLHGLARAGKERARDAEARAVEVGKELRGHGEPARKPRSRLRARIFVRGAGAPLIGVSPRPRFALYRHDAFRPAAGGA